MPDMEGKKKLFFSYVIQIICALVSEAALDFAC